ncbi:MAG: hypothetical protein ACFE9Q_05585 [Candidatus Hodarchaeota archaeon]
MKKNNFIVLICVLITNLTIFPLFYVVNSYGATEEIDSEFGESPLIDGYIDLLSGEWNKATKEEFLLKDLPIKCWVMQNDNNLYISIQLELEPGEHELTEFIGLVISNSSSENKEDFIDAKIVQFSNISENEFDYFDYYINNSIFSIDTENNGDGAANLNGLTSTYEFSIPINNIIENNEDVVLDYGNTYAFNITYGDTPIYPNGVKKSAIVLINLKSIPSSSSPLTNIILYALCILVFSVVGIIYGFYIYKIFRLKEKIERIKR